MLGVGLVERFALHDLDTDGAGLDAFDADGGLVEQHAGDESVKLEGQGVFGGVSESGAYVIVGGVALAGIVGVLREVVKGGCLIEIGDLGQDVAAEEVGRAGLVLAGKSGELFKYGGRRVGVVARPVSGADGGGEPACDGDVRNR